jgi:hypothetical protein
MVVFNDESPRNTNGLERWRFVIGCEPSLSLLIFVGAVAPAYRPHPRNGMRAAPLGPSFGGAEADLI